MISKPTRLSTLFESTVDVFIGYTVALMTQMIVFPLFEIHVSFAQNNLITIIFTIVSITRTFVIRRLFIRLNFGKYARLAAKSKEMKHLNVR